MEIYYNLIQLKRGKNRERLQPNSACEPVEKNALDDAGNAIENKVSSTKPLAIHDMIE